MAKFTDDAYNLAYKNLRKKEDTLSVGDNTTANNLDLNISIEKYLDEDDNGNKWYVLQVETGKEDNMVTWLNSYFNGTDVIECFVVKRETKRKLYGKWKTVIESLFKGYIFLVSDNPVNVFYRLKDIPSFTKLLDNGDYGFVPLKREEIQFILNLSSGRPDHTVRISTIDLNEGDEIEYIGGDLSMFSGQIKRIDKHKRRAVVEVEMFGRKTDIYMDFEFLKKRDAE